jgi:hypothetical protein
MTAEDLRWWIPFLASKLLPSYCCRSRLKARMSEHNLVQYQQAIDQIDQMLDTSDHRWREYLDQARATMSGLDGISFFDDSNELEAQIRSLNVLQTLAYHDVDSGGVTDIADWVLRRWLKILQDHPQNVEILKGKITWARTRRQA